LLFMGLMTSLSEGIHSIEHTYLAILSRKWKYLSVNFGKTYNATLILVGLRLLGTFPLIFDLF
jgi:hypothetical protein